MTGDFSYMSNNSFSVYIKFTLQLAKMRERARTLEQIHRYRHTHTDTHTHTQPQPDAHKNIELMRNT